MFPILLLLEPLFGSSLTKIRREISKNLLVFQISFAPCRCFLASRHKSICQKTYVCPHEGSSEKDAPKKFELSSLRRHIQKPKTNFFRCPNTPETTQTFKLKNCLFLQHPTENSLFLGHTCHYVERYPFFPNIWWRSTILIWLFIIPGIHRSPKTPSTEILCTQHLFRKISRYCIRCFPKTQKMTTAKSRTSYEYIEQY